MEILSINKAKNMKGRGDRPAGLVLLDSRGFLIWLPFLAAVGGKGLGKVHKGKRPGWGQNESPLGSSLCPIYQEEALKG